MSEKEGRGHLVSLHGHAEFEAMCGMARSTAGESAADGVFLTGFAGSAKLVKEIFLPHTPQ